MTVVQTLFGDELLNAVFANFKPSSQRFKITESKLISVFYEVLRRPEYRPLGQNYPFDSDGMEPRSKAVSDAFDSLQQSRLIGRMNPDLVIYSISDALRVRYEKFIRPKIRAKESLIKKLAAEVESKLDVVT